MENRTNPEKEQKENPAIETDSEKIVRRHLEDEDDEITDADIRNVQIVGGEQELTATDDETRLTDEEQDITRTDKDNELPDPNDKPITPWDVVS